MKCESGDACSLFTVTLAFVVVTALHYLLTMFSVDELLKFLVFSKLRTTSTFAYLLDHHWDQLVVYLLIVPLQWLHVAHLLRNTAWLEYGLLGKLTVLVYVALTFAAWELVRIFAFIFCRRLQAGDSMEVLVAKVLSAGRLFWCEVLMQAAMLAGVAAKMIIGGGGTPAQSHRMKQNPSPTGSSKDYASKSFTKRSDKPD